MTEDDQCVTVKAALDAVKMAATWGDEIGLGDYKVLRALLDRANALERENAALREQLSTMTQAVGLATTIKGDMPMRADDPIGMMQEVCADVTALRARLADTEKALAQLREWKGAACKTMNDYVRDAERHAAAVEAAYCEAWARAVDVDEPFDTCDRRLTAAWLASEAKARLT